MKKCNKCGAIVENEDAFCIHCGGNEFSIIESEQKICTEEPKKICKRCGAEADETARFCVHCGENQFIERTEEQNKNTLNVLRNTTQKGKFKYNFKGWHIPIVISIIAIIYTLIVAITDSSGPNSAANSAANSAGRNVFANFLLPLIAWAIYGIISFVIFYISKTKKHREDVKNGIKRPHNIFYKIFCWLGWLIAFLIYGVATDWDLGDAEMVIPLLIVFVIPAYFIMQIYFAPYLIANSRGHVNETPIFILNILAGWTVLCWIIALVWAFTDATLLDKKKRNQPVLSISHEERLAVIFDLYEKGAITQAEFEERKKLILSDK